MKDYDTKRLMWFVKTVVYTIMIVSINIQQLSAQGDEPDSLSVQEQQFDRIDAIMRDWFDEDGPGGIVLIVQNGKSIVCEARGLANLEHKVPITPATVFNIASLDKQFTAFALALLVAEKSISLDADIHKYLPELQDYGEPITIRQLINHTSGLPDEFSLLQMAGYWTDDVITNDQVFKLLQAQTHLLFQPGEKWQYSNSNYTLIIKIIERISGDRFSEFCQKKIFESLEMANTKFVDDHRMLIEGRAYSYEYSDAGYMHIPVHYCPSLYTTAEDLVKWINNFEDAHVGGPEVMKLISQTGYLNNGEPIDYTFGQFVQEHHGFKSYQHSGHVGAYTCFLVRIPELRLAVACLSNAGYFRATSVGLTVADLFLPITGENDTDAGALEGEMMLSTEKGTSDVTTSINPEKAPKYAGIYQIESTLKVLRVRYDPPVLSLVHLSDEPLHLIPDVNGKFKLEGVSSKISFVSDGSGDIRGLNLHLGQKALAAEKIKSVALNQDQMTRLTGDYFARELQIVCHIRITDSGLIVQHPRHPTNFLTATDSLHFVGEHKWLRQLSFEINSVGRITGFHGNSSYARDIWFQKID